MVHSNYTNNKMLAYDFHVLQNLIIDWFNRRNVQNIRDTGVNDLVIPPQLINTQNRLQLNPDLYSNQYLDNEQIIIMTELVMEENLISRRHSNRFENQHHIHNIPAQIN
jgi:hypothetical protein